MYSYGAISPTSKEETKNLDSFSTLRSSVSENSKAESIKTKMENIIKQMLKSKKKEENLFSEENESEPVEIVVEEKDTKKLICGGIWDDAEEKTGEIKWKIKELEINPNSSRRVDKLLIKKINELHRNLGERVVIIEKTIKMLFAQEKESKKEEETYKSLTQTLGKHLRTFCNLLKDLRENMHAKLN